MKWNLFLHKDMVMSEWLLFRLAPILGKMKAQERLHGLMRRMTAENRSLREILAGDETVRSLLSDDDMDSLDHPERYLGLAVELVEDTLAATTALRQDDPELLRP